MDFLNNFQQLKDETKSLGIEYLFEFLMFKLNTRSYEELTKHFKGQQKNNPRLSILLSNNRGNWHNAVNNKTISPRNLEILSKYDYEYVKCLAHPFWYVLEHLNDEYINIKHSYITKYPELQFSKIKQVLKPRYVFYSSYFYQLDVHQNLDSLTALLLMVKNFNFEDEQYVSRIEAIKAQILAMSLALPFKSIAAKVFERINNMTLRSFNKSNRSYGFDDSKSEEVNWETRRFRPGWINTYPYLRSYIPRFKVNQSFKSIINILNKASDLINSQKLLKGKSISQEIFFFYLLRSESQATFETLKNNKHDTEPIIKIIKQIKKDREENYS